MLNIFYSNKLEALAAQLNANIAAEPLPALVPETVIVESAAMAQWLTQQMACQLGIAANLKFPFPAALVWQTYRQVLPDLPKESRFDRVSLVWRLYRFFASDEIHQLADLAGYISQLANHKQILFFAEHIASLYDQYQIYRPDWLCEWQQGKWSNNLSCSWQAELWHRLCHENDGGKMTQDINRAQVFVDVMRQIETTKKPVWQGLKRLQIFAAATLPQPYIDLFAALSRYIDVNIYVLNPSALFWSDLQTEKQRIRQCRLEKEEDNQQAQVQNELLALMAKQGREYIELLQQQEQYQEYNCFVKVAKNDLLGNLQNDILTLRQPKLHEDKALIADSDQSIQVHSCHSALREVQVLHNQLLKLLDEHSDIGLDDIVIMVPELETYAPYFHAVFSTADTQMQLPYHLAERRSFEDQPVKRTLVQLLKIPALHYKRAEIVSLMQEPSIAKQFGITDVSLLEQLLEQLQVRFLLNNEEWFAMGDSMVSFAWQQAKERLILSYVSAEVEPDVELDVVAGIYADTADQAGCLCEFIDRLELLEYQKQSRTVNEWCSYVDKILQRFFRLDEDSQIQEAKDIRDVLEKIDNSAILADFTEKIEFELFLHAFESGLQKESQHHFFKQGVINIGTLLPMRSLPFKVVCLLGMNDGEFPRPANTDRIDLMLQSPRKGDRNRREEDRYLFLEALLAARNSCYFSYIGKSHVDNSERYPSLLLTELLQHIDDCYRIDGVQKVSGKIVRQHKLQAFDSDYFGGCASLLNFNQHHLKQAERVLLPKITPVFSLKSLDSQSPKQIDLRELIMAVTEPSRFYLGQLDIRPEFNELKDENVESFFVDGLDRYQLLDILFKCLMNNQSMPVFEHLCQKGLLPQAMAGKTGYEAIKQSVYALFDQVNMHHLDLGDGSVEASTLINDVEVCGEITNLNTNRTQRLAALCNKLHGKHLLKAWVGHLFSCCALKLPVRSYILTLDSCYKLNAVDAETAASMLTELLVFSQTNAAELSWFFPRSAWEYASCLRDDANKAESALLKSLFSSDRHNGEWDTLDNVFAYRGHEADIERIKSQAESIFVPVLDYLEELVPTGEVF